MERKVQNAVQSVAQYLERMMSDNLFGIPNRRLTILEAQEMFGIGRNKFDQFRKGYDLGENKAFGGKITFSMHKVLKAIQKINQDHESRYKN